MKKLITLMLFVAITAFSFNIFAQTAPDWNGTTTEGEAVNHYDLLDAGKYVLLDFWFSG